MKPQISILGCGWLGLPLAKSILKKGFKVKGSTTSLDKILDLKNAGIDAYQIALSEEGINGEIDNFLNDSEVLIINIPPKLRKNTGEDFVKKIDNLLPHIEKSLVKKVVFVSSTSVYGDGFPVLELDENCKPQPDTESGKQLLKVEQMFETKLNFQTTIVRFGGLIGEDRHPIRFLAGRKNIENPDAPINLIHLIDCIAIIETIVFSTNLKIKKFDIFNAVAPFHPSRKEYYTQKAIELNLPLPEFEENKTSVGKNIASTKIESLLNYTFQNTTL